MASERPDPPLEPGSPEWETRRRELMREVDHAGWWWLSFADPELPENSQFLGVAVVQGTNILTATMNAALLGINPGGEVMGWGLPPEQVPPPEYRQRLLSRAELEAADLA